MTLGQRFARLVTATVVRFPSLWPLFRRPLRRQFDAIADQWDAMRGAEHLAAFEAGLAAVPGTPRRVLDVGTGTGAGAFAAARRWPDADVTGVDISERMVAAARRNTPAELAGRVDFAVADAAGLPFPDDRFDVVGLANVVPFASELARITAPGGHVVLGFSLGTQTPIYVPPERLRRELERHGFVDVRELAAGRGTAVVARRRAEV